MIDVCLILEATYPYVAGGVSTWVHQLISQMPHLRFGIVHISAHNDPTRTVKYKVPEQVIFLKDVYLHDYEAKKVLPRKAILADYQLVKKFYDGILGGDGQHFEAFVKLFRGKESCFDVMRFFSSDIIYQYLNDYYLKLASDQSYLDFFWTWRETHLPLIQILQTEVPPAKIYHAVSTGYAGLLAALAKIANKSKFFLTEHGIYTHERMLEISQANWIFERHERSYRVNREMSLFKRWWVGLFEVMSRFTYSQTDQIFTLFEGNKIKQILNGADANNIRIIPNGIDVAKFINIKRTCKDYPCIGLVGRVVSIKDIKTFIAAAQLVLRELPTAKFYLVGPTDEEQAYYEECVAMVELLGLGGAIIFTGRKDVREYYAFLDVVVLTSLSEAQPYIILEANAVGIPVVASDVGDCADLLNGRNSADRALGPSGLITEVSNPEATASAIMRLFKDKVFYQACANSGKERVIKYYDETDLLSKYLNIYEQNL